MSTTTTILAAVMATLMLTSSSPAQAAAVERRSVPAMPASEIHSFSLQSWGPHQTSSTGDDAVFVDSGLATAEYIEGLKAQGKKTVCYIDVGTLEQWRTDRSEVVTESDDDMAKQYKGLSGSETWLDITKWEDLKEPMMARISEAASKGCTAVEMDNTDCYENACVAGNSYDALLAKEKEYVNWLIEAVHSKGMAAGLKNSLELIGSVSVEFAINEECQSFKECYYYAPFHAANKVVFGVEYENHDGTVCATAHENNMVTLYENEGKWSNCWS